MRSNICNATFYRAVPRQVCLRKNTMKSLRLVLFAKYCLDDQVRRIRWVRYTARTERKEMHTRFWWGNPEGKRSLGRARHV